MPLTDLCIELRPNLRCGNAYLQFNRQLREDGRKTRIILKEHNVHIMEDDDENNLVIRYNCFGMDIQGISIFTVSGNHLTFRFNYTKIDMDALEQNTVQVDMQPLVMACRENEEFSLICHNCGNELAESTVYKRLREFPSCIVDPSDFFCHNHGSAAESHQDVLVPPERDLFYGLNFIVVNIFKIKGVMNRGGQLYCQRCLGLVGNTVLNDKAAKLWADAVRYLPTSLDITQKRHLFQHPSVTQVMKRLLHTLWPQSLSPLCPTKNRALLFTTLPNRQQQSILIHIVDSQLRVLRRIQPNNPDLQCFFACKMYFGINRHDQQIPESVPKPWQSDHSLPQMEISPRMFQELHTQLTTNSQLVPYAWRFNTAEEKLVLNAGHASQESDDEHSDSDNGPNYSVAAASTVPVPIKMLPQTRRPPSPPVSDSN
ncbi:uncharacterized protein Dwil_GK19715 [Drosophila willistoni]|uniref:Uncharacterized protein n=1 Tax=Drosophila willistoni TaxID=7260 RepID=B4MTF5_DROWI|nr:uncharacterized protein Dwil_GK19715 [Drosophila willistoni]